MPLVPALLRTLEKKLKRFLDSDDSVSASDSTDSDVPQLLSLLEDGLLLCVSSQWELWK